MEDHSVRLFCGYSQRSCSPSINAYTVFVLYLLFAAVFAPTDDAFEEAPALLNWLGEEENVLTLLNILLYHVVNGATVLSADLSDGMVFDTLLEGNSTTISKMGDSIMVNDANVIVADQVASNGVVHVIDKLLIPSFVVLPTLLGVASAESTLSTLVVAVGAAELVDALSGPGPFTLFAPTDLAFGLLPAGTVKTLTEDEDKAPLKDILLYHVVEELITAEIVLDEELTSVTTMQGADLTLSVMDDGTTLVVNGTPVLGTIVTSNGIGHLIGVVLIPPVEVIEATMAPVTVTMAPVSAPTSAPVDMDGALTTSTVVAALVSVAALLMV
jgi:transforming growth factor-beta-induced protein